MRRKIWRRAALLAGAAAAVGFSHPGFAQEQEVAAVGKPLYENNCMVCHGQKAKGDGPMVTFGLLVVPASDLTQLSKKHNGEFPFWKTYRVIDGREKIKGHGSEDMPLWGDEFRLDAGSGMMAQTEVRGKILALVYYLQSIQEK